MRGDLIHASCMTLSKYLVRISKGGVLLHLLRVGHCCELVRECYLNQIVCGKVLELRIFFNQMFKIRRPYKRYVTLRMLE